MAAVRRANEVSVDTADVFLEIENKIFMESSKTM
jgi:hypothetical protein